MIHPGRLGEDRQVHLSANLHLKRICLDHVLHNHAGFVVYRRQIEIQMPTRLGELVDGNPEELLAFRRGEDVLHVCEKVGRVGGDEIAALQGAGGQHPYSFAGEGGHGPRSVTLWGRVDAVGWESHGVLEGEEGGEFGRDGRGREDGDAPSVTEGGVGVDT